MPVFRNSKPPWCERPAKETLDAVEAWYKGLWKDDMSKQDIRFWILATMMYKFAVRNGDVGTFTLRNFSDHDGSTYLIYTPHKTAHSSGTVVNWPVHPDLYERIRKAAEILDLDEDEIFVRSYRETSAAVNRMLRKIPGLAEKEKASYELRKMCVDHAYHSWGVEMAAAISGDDIKTLTYFYADVSHVKASPALVAGQV